MDVPTTRESALETLSPPCPTCGGDNAPTPLFVATDLATDRPGVFGVGRCLGCGQAFTTPRPSSEGLSLYYEDVYSGANADAMYQAQTSLGMRLVVASRWGFLRRFLGSQAAPAILDVGCSYGTFLAHARKKSGARIAGCDTDRESLEKSVVADVADLRCGDLGDVAFAHGSFDIVTLFHCLEHTEDPVGTLRGARALLKPGGLLVVEVPHFGGLWRRAFGRFWFPLLVPQHLQHYDRATLGLAIREAGFLASPLVHRGCWAPLELTGSVGLMLKSLVGAPPAKPPPWGRWLLHRALAIPMALFFFLVDLPVSLVLARTPLSGHQILVARRAAEGS